MKKRTVTLIAVVILAVIVLSGCFFTVREDEYACTVRFSKIIATTSDAGLHFKLPFVDSVKYFTKATQLYDIPPSEVLTSDKQNMTVDCYILWSIGDPKLFYQRLGTTSNAEQRLDALTYNELKTVMGHPGPGGHCEHGGRRQAERHLQFHCHRRGRPGPDLRHPGGGCENQAV